MTDTLLASGQPDTAADSTQTADGAADTAATNAEQQQTDAAPADESAPGTDEGKTDEGKTDDQQPEGAPEQYEDFAAPEGVTLDADATAEFKALAKELNLTQAQAQKVVDLGPKMMAKWAANQAEQVATMSAQWAKDAQADKEFGGEKLQENLALAQKAVKEFGSPELQKLLNESGLGNHPEIIRAFFKAGKAISEDGFVAGRQQGPAKTAQSLYAKSNMNP